MHFVLARRKFDDAFAVEHHPRAIQTIRFALRRGQVDAQPAKLSRAPGFSDSEFSLLGVFERFEQVAHDVDVVVCHCGSEWLAASAIEAAQGDRVAEHFDGLLFFDLHPRVGGGKLAFLNRKSQVARLDEVFAVGQGDGGDRIPFQAGHDFRSVRELRDVFELFGSLLLFDIQNVETLERGLEERVFILEDSSTAHVHSEREKRGHPTAVRRTAQLVNFREGDALAILFSDQRDVDFESVNVCRAQGKG